MYQVQNNNFEFIVLKLNYGYYKLFLNLLLSKSQYFPYTPILQIRFITERIRMNNRLERTRYYHLQHPHYNQNHLQLPLQLVLSCSVSLPASNSISSYCEPLHGVYRCVNKTWVLIYHDMKYSWVGATVKFRIKWGKGNRVHLEKFKLQINNIVIYHFWTNAQKCWRREEEAGKKKRTQRVMM